MCRLKAFGVRLIGVRRSDWGDLADGSAALLDERALWPQLQRWLPEADLVVRPGGFGIHASSWAPFELANADVHLGAQFLMCSQNEETRGMVNEQVSVQLLQRRVIVDFRHRAAGGLTFVVTGQFLRHCKRGVRIVNVARGGLLDYDAVKIGLESGIIAGMGLDVHWQVLLVLLWLQGLTAI